MKNVRTLAVALSLAMTPCVAFAQDPPQDPPTGGGRGGRAAERRFALPWRAEGARYRSDVSGNTCPGP